MAFKKGESGNKAGRPKGAKNKATILREAMLVLAQDEITENIVEVIKVVAQRAKSGDMQAAKMLLDRAIPARKAVEHTGMQGNGNVMIKITAVPAPEPIAGQIIEGVSRLLEHQDDE